MAKTEKELLPIRYAGGKEALKRQKNEEHELKQWHLCGQETAPGRSAAN